MHNNIAMNLFCYVLLHLDNIIIFLFHHKTLYKCTHKSLWSISNQKYGIKLRTSSWWSPCPDHVHWFLVGIFHSSCRFMKYPYTKTIPMISTYWSLTHLFLLYYPDPNSDDKAEQTTKTSVHKFYKLLYSVLCILWPKMSHHQYMWLHHHILVKHANHIHMTTGGQIMPWSDCLKTKGNMNMKLRDLSETLIVYILLSTF